MDDQKSQTNLLEKLQSTTNSTFKITQQQPVYKRYLAVFDRHVEFPNGQIIKWDVVGHSFNESAQFVCVLPYNSKNVQDPSPLYLRI